MKSIELKRALRACRGVVLAVLAFSLLINLLTLTSTVYMLEVYDRVIASRSVSTLLVITGITVFAYICMAVLDGVRSQILARLSHWLGFRLGSGVFASTIDVALKAPSAGVASVGLRDLETVRGFITGPAATALLDAPWAPFFCLGLFLFHPYLGIIGIVGAVWLGVLAVLNELITKAPLGEANRASIRAVQWTEGALRNAEVVRSLGMTDAVVRRWRQTQESGLAGSQLAGRRGLLVLSVTKFSRLAIQTLLMGVAAWLVTRGETTGGALFASCVLLARALAPVENAIGSWKSFVQARIAYGRLSRLLDSTPSHEPGMRLPKPSGQLAVEHVSFMPPGGDEPTLRGVTFRLDAGEVLGIIGPSAAGKSTLARLITGAWRPTGGKIRLDGADISVWHAADGSRHVGYLPQDVELFAGTIAANIARLGAVDMEEVVRAATIVGMHEVIAALPKGYDTEIGLGGAALSGGQRQRIGLARAIYGRPSLVVLDEPNASLDAEGDAALIEAIRRLKGQGTTIVVIAHRVGVLGVADKLLLLRNGMVETFGARQEILNLLNRRNQQAPGPQGQPAMPAPPRPAAVPAQAG